VIKYFTIENYRSIKNENILEFDANLENSVYVAHPMIGFAGANASGKTATLQALTFVLWFMQHSFLRLDKNDKIPYEPFYTRQNLPSQFQLIFAQQSLVDGKEQIVDYEYQLCLTSEQVLKEELHYYPNGKEELVYRREGNKVRFGDNVSPIETKDLRPNCSIVSFASQFASQSIANACKDYRFYSNLSYKGFKEEDLEFSTLDFWLRNKERKDKVQKLLKIADLGIENIYVQSSHENIKKLFQEIYEAKREKPQLNEDNRIEESVISGIAKALEEENNRLFQLFFKHKLDNTLVDFSSDSESAGTLQFLTVLYRILNALEKGSLLILDEIELKLHQNLVAYLLGLFENPAENKHNAQLICSFHNTYFMEFLKPEQLWFAEKNEQGQTELFSASAFTDIKELYKKDLELLYRVGRFGAKPRAI